MDSPYIEATAIEGSSSSGSSGMSKKSSSIVSQRGSVPGAMTEQAEDAETAAAAAQEAGEDGFPTESPFVENGEHPSAMASTRQSTNLLAEFKSYAKSGDLLEMVGYVIFMAILAGLPRLISNTFYREIPYQETAAGDILLELLLDHDLVDETVNSELQMCFAEALGGIVVGIPRG